MKDISRIVQLWLRRLLRSYSQNIDNRQDKPSPRGLRAETTNSGEFSEQFRLHQWVFQETPKKMHAINTELSKFHWKKDGSNWQMDSAAHLKTTFFRVDTGPTECVCWGTMISSIQEQAATIAQYILDCIVSYLEKYWYAKRIVWNPGIRKRKCLYLENLATNRCNRCNRLS